MPAEASPPAAVSASDPRELAHHICNLVQVIDGYVELAARRSGDETTQRYLADARAAAAQLIALCRHLPPPATGAEG